jgi:hypothetical protein
MQLSRFTTIWPLQLQQPAQQQARQVVTQQQQAATLPLVSRHWGLALLGMGQQEQQSSRSLRLARTSGHWLWRQQQQQQQPTTAASSPA